jgi:hypothetical protein
MLLRRADKLRISVNKEAPNGFYLAAKNNGIINRPGLEITVIGPTAGNLKKLQAEWDEWIKKHEQKIAAGQYTREVAANLDRSVPNLSSLVLLIKAGDESLLLAGDCRGDHLQQALIETGLSGDGRFHVNMLKVPHHGSKRNNPPAFLEQVTADTYIFSADGTNDNPDEETLYRIVDVAKTAGRKIRMVFTNETASTTALQGKYPPHELGIQFLAKGKKYLTIKSH